MDETASYLTHCPQVNSTNCQLAVQRNTAQGALRSLVRALKEAGNEYMSPDLAASLRTAEAVVNVDTHRYSRFCLCGECAPRHSP